MLQKRCYARSAFQCGGLFVALPFLLGWAWHAWATKKTGGIRPGLDSSPLAFTWQWLAPRPRSTEDAVLPQKKCWPMQQGFQMQQSFWGLLVWPQLLFVRKPERFGTKRRFWEGTGNWENAIRWKDGKPLSVRNPQGSL